MKTLDDLFMHFLQDIYYAERQILKALPRMTKNAKDPDLMHAFTVHREETVHQLEFWSRSSRSSASGRKLFLARPSRACSKKARRSWRILTLDQFVTLACSRAGKPSSTTRWPDTAR